MTTYNLSATTRYTDGASKIENFLDDNEQNLSPNVFDELDVLAGEIETIEDIRQVEIDELRNEKEDLEKQIEELEKELEELR